LRIHRFIVCIVVVVTLAACSSTRGRNVDAPFASYHQHLISPAMSEFWSTPDQLDAQQLIQQLDAAQIERALVLSVAYAYGDERRQVPDELTKVRAENDWTASQVSRYPERLFGFCGVSPLRAYALEEIERCTKLPHMAGVKLHLGNSGVDLRKPEHVERLAAFFAAADAKRLPIAIHIKTRTGWPYGRDEAQTFLNQVVARAPNTPIQIAHLAGAGPGYQDIIDDALSVFVEAIQSGDAKTRNLWFDVTTIATVETTPENGALIARRLRELGLQRILFGADHSIGGNPAPAAAWKIFSEKVPLTAAERRTIAANVAPYVRGR